MRRALRLLPVLLLLGACSWFRPSAPAIPPEEDTPDHRACREEARNSPAMRDLNRQRYTENQFNTERLAREERTIFVREYRNCLRSRGLALPGGVEAPRPR